MNNCSLKLMISNFQYLFNQVALHIKLQNFIQICSNTLSKTDESKISMH